MKKNILYLLPLALLIGFTACEKEKKTGDDKDIVTHSDDQSLVGDGTDDIANDIDILVEADVNFSGRLQDMQGLVCNADYQVNLITNPMTITITYSGTNCLGNRERTGTVTLSMAQGTHWTDANAAINVTFNNLKIKRLSDNKSVTVNGTQTYTNVSGGLLKNLASLGTVTHKITSSGLSIKFDNGSQRTWQVAKQRVFTFGQGGVVVSTTGLHTDGSNTGITEWGTNRFGGAFATSIVEPLIVRQDCDFRLTSGKVKHTTALVTAQATFGLNANGDATSCPGTGHYYLKIVWTGVNGNSVGLILPY